MNIEQFKCEKCGCDKLVVSFQHGYNLFIDPSEACPEQLEIHCPRCGSDLTMRYNEPASMRRYMIIDNKYDKKVNIIFTNVEGYKAHVVNTLDDNSFVFFSRVGNDHKEYLMNDNNKLRSENAALKNEIKELKKKSSVEEYMKLSDNDFTKYKQETDDHGYFKLWKDLTDEYCKLEDKYNKVYVECQKYKKYWEEIVKRIKPTKKTIDALFDTGEPSGTGCCLNRED